MIHTYEKFFIFYIQHLFVFVAPEEYDNSPDAVNEKGAIKAIHHGQRFSRKLKRRLTQRTLAEARALKRQSKEAIHVLLYAAELVKLMTSYLL